MKADARTTAVLTIDRLTGGTPGIPHLPDCGGSLDRFLGLRELNSIYAETQGTRGITFASASLNQLKVKAITSPIDLERIPKSGPTVVVANHPYGMLDGLLLLHTVGQVRQDVRILGNKDLSVIPELRELLLPVDPMARRGSHHDNARSLRHAVHWVKEGGALLVFPAGAISRPTVGSSGIRVEDRDWKNNIGRLLRCAAAPVVPVYISGHSSKRYLTAGTIHPSLRLLLQPRELLRQSDREVDIRIGHPIRAAQVTGTSDENELMQYLRFRTYLLQMRDGAQKTTKLKNAGRATATVVLPGSRENILSEINALDADRLLVDAGSKKVYVARAAEIPHTLQEIGRLREITFRGVGEGTGRPLDLDEYDLDYLHLFAWDAEAKEIIGGYRMGLTDEILTRKGINGLYSTSRFGTETRFFQTLGPGLELGRSFVQPKYQRQYNSLLLLWKGIGQFVADHPRYGRLFGMVSISNDYQEGTRALMANALLDADWDKGKGRFLHPENPPHTADEKSPILKRDLQRWGTDIGEVNTWVADIEQELSGVPVLVRQYAKLGAEFLGFNIDSSFGNTLDGMIVVELAQAPPAQLKRLFGKEIAEKIIGHEPASAQLRAA